VLISGLVVAGDGTIETEGMCNRMVTGHCPIEAELIERVTGSAEAEVHVGTTVIGDRKPARTVKQSNNMKPEIGISEKNRDKSIKVLSALLADEMVLYVKTRKFHWNVSGNSFMEFHKLFQSQYTELEEVVDAVAERISKLGGNAIGTLSEFKELTQLKESPAEYPEQKEMLKELLSDHETIVIQLRTEIEEFSTKSKDSGSTDFLTKLMEQHETTAWVIRRYLK